MIVSDIFPNDGLYLSTAPKQESYIEWKCCHCKKMKFNMKLKKFSCPFSREVTGSKKACSVGFKRKSRTELGF